MTQSQLGRLAVCALALTACGPAVREQDTAFLPTPPADASTLVVRNDYMGELDVFALNGRIRHRIGTVAAGRIANFRIPGTLLVRPEIQFQLDPVGPIEPFTYRPIAVGPGNIIELSAAPALPMSSYAILVNP